MGSHSVSYKHPAKPVHRPSITPYSSQFSLSPSPAPSKSDSVSATSTGKRQDAIEIFQQYGIPRPQGWFSQHPSGTFDPESVFELNKGRVCHSCEEPLSAVLNCPACGHKGCLKCSKFLPSTSLDTEGAYPCALSVDRSLSPQPTANSVTSREFERLNTPKLSEDLEKSRSAVPGTQWQFHSEVRSSDQAHFQGARNSDVLHTEDSSLKLGRSIANNHFIVEDQRNRSGAKPDPLSTYSRYDAESKTFSPMPPQEPEQQSRTSSDTIRCVDPSCRATHKGHHPFRHSIGCAEHREAAHEEDELFALKTSKSGNGFYVRVAESLPSSQAHGRWSERRYSHADNRFALRYLNDALKREPAIPHRKSLSHSPSDAKSLRSYSDYFGSASRPLLRAPVPSPAFQTSHAPSPDTINDITRIRGISLRSHHLEEDQKDRTWSVVPNHSIEQDSEVRSDWSGDQPVPNIRKRPIWRRLMAFEDSSDKHSDIFEVSEPKMPTYSQIPTKEMTGEDVSHLSEGPELESGNVIKAEIHDETPTKTVKQISMTSESVTSQQGALSSPKDRQRVGTGKPNISMWRQQLRKVPKPEGRPPKTESPPPAIKLRHSLNKVNAGSPPRVDHIQSGISCPSSISSSLERSGPLPRYEEDDFMMRGDLTEDTIRSKTCPPQMKVEQVKMQGAWKDNAELDGKSLVQDGTGINQTRFVGVGDSPVHRTGHVKESARRLSRPRRNLSSEHECTWRDKYLVLNSELESNREIRGARDKGGFTEPGAVPTAEFIPQHECTSIDIEGLTIVVHMRGKDDVVINTSLK